MPKLSAGFRGLPFRDVAVTVPSAPPYEPSPRLAAALLLAIVAAATLLRLPTLGVQSIWADESATWLQVSGSLGDLFARTSEDNYPPLYNLLAWLCVQAFGDAEWTLRLPSAVLGLATVPLLYMLGARIGGRAVGLLAALLLTFAGFHIWHSQEARMYALLAFGATTHGLAALRYADRPGLPAALPVALSGCILVYSHPYGALTLFSIALGFGLPMLLRRDVRPALGLVAAEALVALAFLPWALVLLGRAERIIEFGFWIAPLTPASVLAALSRTTSGLIYLLPLAIILIFIRRRLRPAPASNALWLLASWTVLPSVLGIAASLLTEPVFHPRYVIGSLPPALIWLSLALLAPARQRRGVAIALGVGLAVGLATWLAGSPLPRPDWRAMGTSIEAQLQSGDCVSSAKGNSFRILRYYAHQDFACKLTGPPSTTAATAPAASRIFVVLAVPEVDSRETYLAPFATDRPLLTHIERPHIALYLYGARMP